MRAGEQPAVGIVAGPVVPDVFGEQGDETVGDVDLAIAGASAVDRR